MTQTFRILKYLTSGYVESTLCTTWPESYTISQLKRKKTDILSGGLLHADRNTCILKCSQHIKVRFATSEYLIYGAGPTYLVKRYSTLVIHLQESAQGCKNERIAKNVQKYV